MAGLYLIDNTNGIKKLGTIVHITAIVCRPIKQNDEWGGYWMIDSAILSEDMKDDRIRGIPIGSQRFITGEKMSLYVNPKDFELLKSVKKRSQAIEFKAVLEFTENVDKVVNGVKYTYYKLEAYPSVSEFKILDEHKIVKKIKRLIKRKQELDRCRRQDETFKKCCGLSLIKTDSEPFLIEAKASDIGIYKACKLFQDCEGNVTIEYIAACTKWSTSVVKKAFKNLEKYGYLKKVESDKKLQHKFKQAYHFEKSLFKDKFSDFYASLSKKNNDIDI